MQTQVLSWVLSSLSILLDNCEHEAWVLFIANLRGKTNTEHHLSTARASQWSKVLQVFRSEIVPEPAKYLLKIFYMN